MDIAAAAANSTTSALPEHVDRLMSANVDMQATSTTSPEAPPVEPPEPLGLVPANVDTQATSTTSPEAAPVEPPPPLPAPRCFSTCRTGGKNSSHSCRL